MKLIKHKRNLIALGGITKENLDTIKEIGFGGAALLGSVWEHKSPVKYLEEILKAAL